jgi:hypothetical protein
MKVAPQLVHGSSIGIVGVLRLGLELGPQLHQVLEACPVERLGLGSSRYARSALAADRGRRPAHPPE